MKFKKIKLSSKKGMTLVELIIGIAIVVIIFASTLGTMTNGYTTTVYNADKNKVAAQNASLNQVITETVKKMGINEIPADAPYSAAPAVGAVATSGQVPNVIHEAADFECSGVQYVEPANFPNQDISNQYTIIFDTASTSYTNVSSPTSSIEIKGITIRTAMNSADGMLIYESFVPYKS